MRVELPEFDRDRKARLKMRVMNQIDSPVFEAFPELSLDNASKAFLKERILTMILGSSQKNYWVSRFFAAQKRVVSFGLMFLMMFGMFSFVNIDTNVVRAGDFTRLDYYSGFVELTRDGEVIELLEGMELYENDLLKTGIEGVAVIEFFDDSVSRLKNNTEIEISELASFDGSVARTYVEIEVLEGAVWAKVVNLVERTSSFVVKANDVYAQTKKAAFTVEIESDEVEVEVYNNNVEVHRPYVFEEEAAQVMTGQKIVVTEEEDMEVEESVGEDEWVLDNLEQDVVYVAEVEERIVEEKKVLIASNDDGALRENAALFLTFDDVKKRQLGLELAENDFVEAEVRLGEEDLSDEEQVELEVVIMAFSDEVKEYSAFIEEVAEQDEKYAYELETELDQKLLLLKKDLSLVLPDSPVYLAKEVVDDLDELNVEGEIDLAEKKVDLALDKLSEVEELANKGETESIEGVIEDYEQEMTEAIDLIVETDEGSEGVLEKIVEVENIRENLNIDYDSLEVGNYGVEIYGDKPISPLLNSIE